MSRVEIKTKIDGTGDVPVIVPVIPFDEFPIGQRSVGPDKGGNLVWTVIVED